MRLQIILNIKTIQDHRSTQDSIAQIMCAIVLSANSYREMHDTAEFRPENEDEDHHYPALEKTSGSLPLPLPLLATTQT
jgi:hypothetical protein